MPEKAPCNYADLGEERSGKNPEDSLWKMRAYRLSLLLADLAWYDSSKLAKDMRARAIAGQLFRSIGSVGANLAEGCSRGTGKDRPRFYEYALGSARYGRDWYQKARFALGEEVTIHRQKILTEIIKLLLTMVGDQRQAGRIGEVNEIVYGIGPDLDDPCGVSDDLAYLLSELPILE